MGASDSELLGDALMLLMEGSHYTRLTFPRGRGPETALVFAARALMERSRGRGVSQSAEEFVGP